MRESTADELGAALRNLLELRGLGFADLDASIISSTVPQLEPEWVAMAERYLGHGMLVVGPGLRTGMPIRYDNPREIGADRLVNAVAVYERFGGAVRRASTSAPRSPSTSSRAAGEYLGGIIAPGVEISLDALTERGAKLPKIDLAPPRALIGKSTVDAIRSGVVFGYAGAVDGDPAAACGPRWATEPTRSPPAGWRATSCRSREEIDEVDEMLTLTGLRLLLRAQRRFGAYLTDSWQLGPAHDAQPRRARAAGRDRQLVRAAAGQALRRRARGLARWSRASRSTTATRRPCTSCCASTPTSARRPGRRSSSSARTPTSCARRPRPSPSAGADIIDLNMGCPVPKVCKTGAGAALLGDPDTAVAVARAAREGSGLPVTVKLRSGRRRGETDGCELAHRLVDEAGVAAIGFHPRSAQVHHKGVPDYDLAAGWSSRCRRR